MPYDIALFSGEQPTLLTGRPVVGAEKLAQKVLALLLKSETEVPHSVQGCGFVELIQNRAVTEADLITSLAVASVQISRLLRAVEVETDTDHDRIDRLKITQLVISHDALLLELDVITKAGTASRLRLPLTFLT